MTLFSTIVWASRIASCSKQPRRHALRGCADCFKPALSTRACCSIIMPYVRIHDTLGCRAHDSCCCKGAKSASEVCQEHRACQGLHGARLHPGRHSLWRLLAGLSWQPWLLPGLLRPPGPPRHAPLPLQLLLQRQCLLLLRQLLMPIKHNSSTWLYWYQDAMQSMQIICI